MESSDSEGGVSPGRRPAKEEKVKPTHRKSTKRINFRDFRFNRTKTIPATATTATTPTTPTTPTTALDPAISLSPQPTATYEADARDDFAKKIIVRTRSDEVGIRSREDWASGILAQQGLQESVVALRASVADYEKEASSQQWKDLLKIQGDIRELSTLADTSKAKSHNNANETDDSIDGLSKFTAVAFEYSKLLDVVMNQAPEYAALAWGAIKFLLVGHVNHSKLKHNVHHYLVEFGQQFGVVNQLMASLPTGKMLEAVAEAYAGLSKFLAKAVKYYRESRLMSAIKALGFPWETRFQVLISHIEYTFKRIRDLASAGHFSVTVQSQNLLRGLSYDQQEMRREIHQDSANLRKQLKDELKDEVRLLFDSFDRNWIQRFEQIMESAVPALPAAGSPAQLLPPARSTTMPLLPSQNGHGQPELSNPTPPAAIEYAESMVSEKPPIDTAEALQNVTFLADHVGNPKRLRRFRDRCFPLLHHTDHDDARLRVLFKHLTQMDLQQCVGLLRHESVKTWIESDHSRLIWINTQKVYGIADWATSFATRVIEFAGKINYATVLYHFCGSHPASNKVSTVSVTIQSMIMQILQVHHEQFLSRKVFPFTLEHFQDAAGDMTELWNLLLACIAEAKLRCVWFIIDHFDNLQKGSDWDFLVSAIQQLAEDDTKLFKIFITARGTGNETRNGIRKALADMSKDGEVSSRVAVVTVPRAISRQINSIFGKQKRPSRLPDHIEEDEVPEADIDQLLDSGTDDEPWEDKKPPDQGASHVVESPTSINSRKGEKGSEDEDDDLDLSDSSLDFMKDDPLASSAESGWERSSIEELQQDLNDVDLEDSDKDFLVKKSKGGVESDESSSDSLLTSSKKRITSNKDRSGLKATGKKSKISTERAQRTASNSAAKRASFNSSSEDEPIERKPVVRIARKSAFDSSGTESDEYGYI